MTHPSSCCLFIVFREHPSISSSLGHCWRRTWHGPALLPQGHTLSGGRNATAPFPPPALTAGSPSLAQTCPLSPGLVWTTRFCAPGTGARPQGVQVQLLCLTRFPNPYPFSQELASPPLNRWSESHLCLISQLQHLLFKLI